VGFAKLANFARKQMFTPPLPLGLLGKKGASSCRGAETSSWEPVASQATSITQAN